MTKLQRLKSDLATMDRRELEDKTVRDNRNRNDELTAERRTHVDKEVEDHRLRNDLITENRREEKDMSLNSVLAILLSALIVVAIGNFFLL